MQISVLVATYNEPAWLEKVLWGFGAQTRRDFQLVVADDGSGPETRTLVERAAAELPFPVLHVWHEDLGYRKCEILNRAVLAADGDYLVFTDGDCVPRADFVQVHADLARPRRFLSGGALRLPRSVSERIRREDVESGRFADPRWLAESGWEPGRHRLRLLSSRLAARALDRITPTRPTWNGGNASTWRSAVEAVNGFDNGMKYGGQDRAFGERLDNAGYGGVQVRHRAVTLHLEHGRPYRTEESIRRNRDLRRAIRAEGRVRAAEGLAEIARTAGGIENR